MYRSVVWKARWTFPLPQKSSPWPWYRSSGSYPWFDTGHFSVLLCGWVWVTRSPAAAGMADAWSGLQNICASGYRPSKACLKFNVNPRNLLGHRCLLLLLFWNIFLTIEYHNLSFLNCLDQHSPPTTNCFFAAIPSHSSAFVIQIFSLKNPQSDLFWRATGRKHRSFRSYYA